MNLIVIAMLLVATFAFIRAARPLQASAGAGTAPVIKDAPISSFSRAENRRIDTVVLHYMSAINVNPARWDDAGLCRAILQKNRVSAHYLIDRGGVVYRLVQEKNVAWHAGGSIMPAPDNRRNVNRFSIGIEMIATANSGFTAKQYSALGGLLQQIKQRHTIGHIVGHDAIAGRRAVELGLRRDMKVDPGAKLDWGRIQP